MDLSLNSLSRSVNYNNNTTRKADPAPATPAKEEKEENQGINDLSKLLATRSIEEVPENITENPIYTQLTGIDAELTAIEEELRLFNETGEATVEDFKGLMERILQIEQELSDIEDALKKYEEASKERKDLGKQIQSSFDQANILKQALQGNPSEEANPNTNSIEVNNIVAQ